MFTHDGKIFLVAVKKFLIGNGGTIQAPEELGVFKNHAESSFDGEKCDFK